MQQCSFVMNLNEIPTPISDSHSFVTTRKRWEKREEIEESVDVVDIAISQDLERRLIAARQALDDIVMKPETLVGAVVIAERALILTAPKS